MKGKKEDTTKVLSGTNESNQEYSEEESSVFSNSELSDIEESFTFWTKDMESCEIFDLYKEFESSEEEENTETKKVKNSPKEYCTTETNTMSVETDIIEENNGSHNI